MKTMISFLPEIVFPVVLFAFSASGQKLPNVQEASLRAPAAIKIDGKATEWNNQFQAYNKATEIYYTISNDNEKLYLVVQSTDLDIINKIVCGGITLTINGSGKMKDQGGRAITFPYLKIDRVNYSFAGTGVSAAPPIPSINMVMENSENSKELIDSFVIYLIRTCPLKQKILKWKG